MNFNQLLQNRRSIKNYQPGKTIPEDELKGLFEEVALSPSSFNLQHWTFIVMTDPEIKKQAREIAWGQPQVEDSSAAILVAGKLDAWKDAPRIYGEMPKEVQERSIPMITNFYQDKDQLERDEAIRSASLAAMTLMYAAKSRGYDTGPMIGFDQEKMAEFVKLPPNYIPVMLVVLGHGNGAPWPRQYRRPIGEIVRMEQFNGRGLGA